MAVRFVGVSIRKHLFLSEGYLEVALIFIAICWNVPTPSYAKPGFLSIDCGNSGANYTDNGLYWVTDSGTYVKTGNSSYQQPVINSSEGMSQSLRTFRYFPERRNKHCYELPLTNITSYLVRASFYMNESVLNESGPFLFIVSIGANNWFTIASGDPQSSLFVVQEAIFHNYPVSDSSAPQIMYFCLQPVVGVPFISSLELRPLNFSMYSYQGRGNQYLALLVRYNLGATKSTPSVRFPEDSFDRIWQTPDASLLFSDAFNDSIVTTPTPPDTTTNADVYFVPPEVMRDGWLMNNSADLCCFVFNLYNTPQVYLTKAQYAFVIVYVEHLKRDSRTYSMNVALDEMYGSAVNFSNQAAMQATPNYILSFDSLQIGVMPPDSASEPTPAEPTLNALEVYGQYTFNFSTTNSTNDEAITALKTSLSLTDWQGDPCVPVPHDWLSCSLSGDIDLFPFRGSLHASYLVTTLSLSNLKSNNFSLFTATLANRGPMLANLTEVSITYSGIDGPTFQLLWKNLFTNLVSLTLLDLSYNAISSLPAASNNFPATLVVLDLSHNQLQGEISSLDQLVQNNSGSLAELYVSHNNFRGTFSNPFYFSSLPNLLIANFDNNSIQGTLNLSAWYNTLQQATYGNSTGIEVTSQLFSFVNNNISNIYPNAKAFESAMAILLKNQSSGILLGGNPYCGGAKLYIQRYLCRYTINDDIKNLHSNKEEILIIGLSSGLVTFLLGCVTFATLWRLWKQAYTLREIQQALVDRKVQPPFYQYNQLKLATRNFHKDNKLGHGGFGVVYKGVLEDGTTLAAKKLFNSQRVQVLDEFLNEVVLITGIKHKNLVQLKGCSIKDKQRILIYEYVDRGNLAETLWGSKAHEGGLNWEKRLNICVGVARGLSYLHEELQPSIIHRDIKPENILLDKDYKPKIADFGLAQLFSEETTQASYMQISQIAGTRGYFAPEYALHGQLSNKADVYSYGILVLEVVFGRRCIDLSLPVEQQILKDWVNSMRKEKSLFNDLHDLQPELRENSVKAEVIKAINIGLLCTQHYPERRPSMSQVVTMFLGRMDVDVEVLLEEFDNDHSNFKDILATIEHNVEYPTLQTVEEDSAIFPLLDVDPQPSLRSSSLKLSRKSLVELSSHNV